MLLLELAIKYGPEIAEELKSWILPSTRMDSDEDRKRKPFGHLVADREKPGKWEEFRVYKHYDRTFSFASHTGFLTAEDGGGGIAIANRPTLEDWQKWFVIDLQDGSFGLRTKSGRYLCVNGDGTLVTADRKALGEWETFTLVHDEAKKTCSIRCWNGKYLSAQP